MNLDKIKEIGLFASISSLVLGAVNSRSKDVEPRMWLEKPLGEDALAWVKEQNELCAKEKFAQVKGTQAYNDLLAALEDKDKIPYVTKIGEFCYNFWTDDVHVRGIWRRIKLEDYIGNVDNWETILDLDQLNKEEDDGKNSWVWGGFSLLDEGEGVPKALCMIRLSPGGSDAHVAREFDLNEKKFLSEKQNAFFVPEAKTRLTYKNRNTLVIGTDFGSDSLTSSGYPMILKEWKRGTPLSEAKTVFEGKPEDVSSYCSFSHNRGHTYEWRNRSITFYTGEFNVQIDGKGPFYKVPVQEDAEVSAFADQFLIELRSDWEIEGKTFVAGSLLAGKASEIVEGNMSSIIVLFSPGDGKFLKTFRCTKTLVVISILNHVLCDQVVYEFDQHNSTFTPFTLSIDNESSMETLDIWGVEGDESDDLWMTKSGYVTPTTLYYVPKNESPVVVRSLKHQFNAEGIEVKQFFATSKDGTKIPYFQMRHKKYEGTTTKTLLSAYGGFEIPLVPNYQVHTGKGWMENGNTYVIANIRGGGEYGPKWHQDALKSNRQRCYEDLEAVAKDLVERKVTTVPQLACWGGSNGGLLVGNMLVRSPELFGAIVCAVPLLDMKRYNKLLAGASWMAEYGNPDIPEEWEYIQHFSPYHMLDKNKTYPSILFHTSTKDDRVCPSHARKMVHKMREMGLGEKVYYYENVEGGHAGAADLKQKAFVMSLTFSFLEDKLKQA